MAQDNFSRMNRDEVIGFIKENMNNDESYYDIEEALIEAILRIIPLIGHYEEEDRKINFRIALGRDNDMQNVGVSSYALKNYTWIEEDKGQRISKIEKMIKEVAVFCEKSADIYLVQNENEIECGVFFAKMDSAEGVDANFVQNGFIIFQHIYKNKVLARAKEKNLFICMDFEEEKEIKVKDITSELYKNSIYTRWSGIFERVRRCVHGTICLVVEPDWDHTKDNNFVDGVKTIELDLKLNSKFDATDLEDYNNKLEMFFSMLNYDGITIIDTAERIRAYNLFCKVDACEQEIGGGARHKAYNKLKKLLEERTHGYLAIYFQSQEGEIEFYRLGNGEQGDAVILNNYFAAEIMIPQEVEITDKFSQLLEEYKKIENDCVDEGSKVKENQEVYLQLTNITKELYEAHTGFNNFYTEPIYARKLSEYITQNPDVCSDVLSRYVKIRRDLLGIVLQCIIGYCSGYYSWAAQSKLENILKNVTMEVWKKYFENKEYLLPGLFGHAYSGESAQRWEKVLALIKSDCPELKEIIDKEKEDRGEYEKLYMAYLDEKM